MWALPAFKSPQGRRHDQTAGSRHWHLCSATLISHKFHICCGTCGCEEVCISPGCVQASGLVPIVEPEVLLDGDHDIDRTLEVAQEIWAQTFKYMADQKVSPDFLDL